jgi:hypothetical protein
MGLDFEIRGECIDHSISRRFPRPDGYTCRCYTHAEILELIAEELILEQNSTHNNFAFWANLYLALIESGASSITIT